MKSWVKKSLLASTATLVAAGIIVLPFLVFSKPADDFVFGNFNSYIGEEIRQEITQKYNIKWQYYGSNAQIPTFIQNKTLDVAIATNNTIGKLVEDDSIQPIPWDKFELIKSDGQLVKNYSDMQEFVTPFTWVVCEIIGKELGFNNLLEYTVPYFMQNFVFAYRGNQINELTHTSSFKEIFDFISNSNEFTSKKSSVMFIEDSRTIYNVASLIANPTASINPTAINETISKINEVYNNITNYYSSYDKKNILTFNADSSIVLNKLALNQSKASFMYNGDAIYAALGGDNVNSTELPNFENQDFYTIVPKENFYALDGFVINKSMNPNKMDKAIELIKEISLSGLNPGEKINDVSNDEYIYTSTRNFEAINYTPCYTKLYDYAIDTTETGYFYESDNQMPQNQINLLVDLLKMDASNITKNNIELPMDNTFASNLEIAFITFKSKI